MNVSRTIKNTVHLAVRWLCVALYTDIDIIYLCVCVCVCVYVCVLTLFNYFLFSDCVCVLLPFDGE